MHEWSDPELVRMARAGDKAAFGVLAARCLPPAERAAYKMVRDDELARDLVQEALLQAYLALDSLRDDARFASWLYGIVLNLCRNYLRAQKVNTVSLEAVLGGIEFNRLAFSDGEPQQVAEQHELDHLLRAALNTLSPENRQATLAFYYEGLSLREIAVQLGISITAVKGRLFKARRQLCDAFLRSGALDGYLSPPERTREMIPVTILDIVRRERTDDNGNAYALYVVVLYDKAANRILPIWVGEPEGKAIALGLLKTQLPRPMTFELIVKLLTAANTQIESVQIQALKEDIFYASLNVWVNGKAQAIDARPSDALALASRLGFPISVSEEVMERAGKAAPHPVSEPSTPRGAEQLAESWQAETANWRKMVPLTEEQQAESERELMEIVFGAP